MTVEAQETVWIELSDGCRLAGRLWLPANKKRPTPAILEYLPYRRRDRHRADDAVLHPAFAEAGYAALRVDMRGSGDSDGIMTDEYTIQEWADAVEVIDWLCQQPWCDGRVGMIGLSWSGFNSLQVAALAPPALKAIVVACASDDRYADDMHYMGGCLLNDNLQYGATLFTWLATPPDPAIVGERWREMWRERLEAVSPPAMRWMGHPERDEYWNSGSVALDYGRIKAAVLAVGGWADGYTNAVMRLLTNLPGPSRGIIGPWGHAFPHVARPGPAIDFLGLVIRWWDHWLKGVRTGIMEEPALVCWMQESEPPRTSFTLRRGRWVAEPTWPSHNVAQRRLYLSDKGLLAEPERAKSWTKCVASPAELGTASGEWCPYGLGPDMPLDQRSDDAGSAVFDSAPLDASTQILGGPVCRLCIGGETSDAIVAVRLNDVSPDGVSRRITYGLLNLAQPQGAELAVPLPSSGQYRTVDVQLNDAGYEVPAGHRIRVAISTAYWPLAVGTPKLVRLAIRGGEVDIPVRRAQIVSVPDLGPPVQPSYPQWRPIVSPARGRVSIRQDLSTETTQVEVVRNLGAVRLEDVDLEMQALGSETYSMPWADPGSSQSQARRLAGFKRADWDVEVRTVSSLRFAGPDYAFEAEIGAFERGKKVFERRWSAIVPRRLAASGADQESRLAGTDLARSDRGSWGG